MRNANKVQKTNYDWIYGIYISPLNGVFIDTEIFYTKNVVKGGRLQCPRRISLVRMFSAQ